MTWEPDNISLPVTELVLPMIFAPSALAALVQAILGLVEISVQLPSKPGAASLPLRIFSGSSSTDTFIKVIIGFKSFCFELAAHSFSRLADK